jgi:hypothetical protein
VINKIEPIDENNQYKISLSNTLPSDITLLCISSVLNYTRPTQGYCVSLEGAANSSSKAAATFYTVNEANENSSTPISKFKFYTETLEPRYTYSEDYYGKKGDKDPRVYCCDYESLEECIKFFKIINMPNIEVNKELAKARFEALFDLDYCLTYYLQMLAFIQVDNAGKNAMFDNWNGGKLYPRPYDMDT